VGLERCWVEGLKGWGMSEWEYMIRGMKRLRETHMRKREFPRAVCNHMFTCSSLLIGSYPDIS